MAVSDLHVTVGQLTRFYNNLVNKLGGLTLTHNDLTDTLKANYDAAYTHSQTAHAPSNAQANVIETVKVNGSALTATEKAVDVTVPTRVSDLSNDSNFIDASVSTLTNFYNKTEMAAEGTGFYNKSAVDAKIVELNSAIAAAASGKITKEIVTTVPSWEDADDNKIYLVKDNSATGNNVYNEYMKIGNTVELLGPLAVDLSGYVRYTDLNYATDSDIDAIFGVTPSQGG